MWDWVGQLEKTRRLGRKVSLVTVAAVEGSVPREPGAKMLVFEDGSILGTIGGGNLELQAIEEAKILLQSGKTSKIKFPLSAKVGQCCGGTVELLFESLNTGPQLYIFGAGHVGQAIAKALQNSIFTVHVIDEREEWISHLPEETIKHNTDPETFISLNNLDSKNSFCLVLTHRHDLDEKLVQLLIQKEFRYLGLIGSETKWQRFKQRLTAKGAAKEKLERVKCPIGIANFGKSPTEIAISVGAELLQLQYGTEN